MLYWYDAAGAFPVARGRSLSVIITDEQGQLLRGGDHDIHKLIAFVVARPEQEEEIVEAIRSTVHSAFLKEEAVQAAV